MGGLVELLGIKGGAEAEGNTGAEEDVVGNGGDTTVVDLDLCPHAISTNSAGNELRKTGSPITLAKETGSNLYLAATSRPTWLPDFESQVALPPASTCELTLW